MKEWSELKEEIREVTPDKEIAGSLFKTAEIRLEALKVLLEKDVDKFASVLVEGYYEIIKEMLTALMAIEGYKTTSHEALVLFLKEFYKEFDDYEITFIDDLRKIRNKIDYKGFSVNPDYLERNNLEIQNIISKLRDVLGEKLK